jgi:hypothetical protein
MTLMTTIKEGGADGGAEVEVVGVMMLMLGSTPPASQHKARHLVISQLSRCRYAIISTHQWLRHQSSFREFVLLLYRTLHHYCNSEPDTYILEILDNKLRKCIT